MFLPSHPSFRHRTAGFKFQGRLAAGLKFQVLGRAKRPLELVRLPRQESRASRFQGSGLEGGQTFRSVFLDMIDVLAYRANIVTV